MRRLNIRSKAQSNFSVQIGRHSSVDLRNFSVFHYRALQILLRRITHEPQKTLHTLQTKAPGNLGIFSNSKMQKDNVMTNKKAENIREIKCNKCKSFLPEEQFYFSGGRPSAYCIPCTYAAEVRKKIAARGVSCAQYEAEKLRRRADIVDREI